MLFRSREHFAFLTLGYQWRSITIRRQCKNGARKQKNKQNYSGAERRSNQDMEYSLIRKAFRYGNEKSQGQRKSGNADGTPVKLYPRKGAVSSDRLLSYSDPHSLSQNEKDEQPKLFVLPARLLLFLIIHPYEKEAKRRLFCVQ